MIAVGILTILAFLLSIPLEAESRAFWLEEGGVVESLSAAGYFLCAALIVFWGGWNYLKKNSHFVLGVILLGLRELDFDKRFTTMGIFKIKFYLQDYVPVFEKIIGLIIIAIIIFIVVSIIKKHFKEFLIGVKNFFPVEIGVLIIFITMLFIKSLDGIDRKLGSVGIIVDEQLSIQFVALEEITELIIPVILISTFYTYFAISKSNISLQNSK